MENKIGDTFNYSEFLSPTKEYRGIPFWAWNTYVSEDKIKKQIEVFHDMGFGGFVVHVRHGLLDEYLGEKFLSGVDLSVDEAKKRELLVWLYDEDRWPSGCAGGIVTRNRRLRQKRVCLTKTPLEAVTREQGIEEGKTYLLAAYKIEVDSDGYLVGCECCEEKNANLFAYVKTAPDSPRYNGQAYVDTMSEEAIGEFIRSTYELYTKRNGSDFGKVIEAIFTDEPQVARTKITAFSSFEKFTMAEFPWSNGFDKTYMDKYGESLVEKLPELVWDRRGGELSLTRYRYNEHIAVSFRKAYVQQISNFCKANGIAFTGHFMLEESLGAQSSCTRDVMRCYKDMDILGIDILCGKYEFTTAKQCQSVARQMGKTRLMSELYGVTDWSADFRDYIHQGNWQAALGITVRVPHLTWMSMSGVGKRDYPACFGYQAPWYKEFSRVEDHFARVNTVITKGKPTTRIGVIHPIESFWLYCGANDKTAQIREWMDKAFHDMCEWLIFNGLDFDYINEALIPEQYSEGCFGERKYDAVVIPDCVNIRKSTVEALTDLSKRGTRVIVAGQIPSYVDGKKADLDEFANVCEQIPMSRVSLTAALGELRDFDLYTSKGIRSDRYIYNQRMIDGDRWIFLSPARTVTDKENTAAESLSLCVNGELTPTLYNTFTGEKETPEYKYENGKTVIRLNACSYDSFLLCLKEGRTEAEPRKAKEEIRLPLSFPSKVSYRLEEPNVCLLDMAEYSYNGTDFLECEEMLRIDTAFREKYGYSSITGKRSAQPWSIENDTEYDLYLRFHFDSETETAVSLAYERLEDITFNGEKIAPVLTGSYVDDDIYTVALGKAKLGRNELLVRLKVGKRFGAEPMYLLGDFNVRLEGIEKTLTAADNKIGFGDVSSQGLAFYGGNIVYSADIDTPECDLEIAVTHYRGDLVKVSVDGGESEAVILPPYKARINNVSAGKHRIEIKCFGNRNNTFGSLHCGVYDAYVGPNHWYKEGDDFTYEYMLKPMGVLSTPRITAIIKK